MTKSSSLGRHPIVCGTDFTAQAASAANVAAGLAVALRYPLLLVHVQAPGSRRVRDAAAATGAADALRREAARLRALGVVTVTSELHRGHADEVLTARARHTKAALIVIGALGTREPTRHFLGSIAERTAELAPVPTLIVRQCIAFEQWLRGERPLRVFLGFDFTASAETAAGWVRVLRPVGPCEITVGHIHRRSEDERRLGISDRPVYDAATRLRELLTRQVADRVEPALGTEGVAVRVEEQSGHIDLGLVAMAAEARSDLIVVGTHQRHGLTRLWTGSVSRGVLTGAPIAVVVVPAATALDSMRPIPHVKRVLVAADLWGSSQRAVGYACAIAQSGGIVRIVHVTHPRSIAGGAFETTLGRTDRHQRHVRVLGRRLEALRPSTARELGIETEAALIECENAVKGICQEAERFDADVVVIGTKGVGPATVLSGSVARAVVARMRRPVLIVNTGKE